MEGKYTEEAFFDRENFTIQSLPKGEYERCIFKSCDFSGSDLKDIQFSECEFENCNLSLAKLTNTAFLNIKFSSCKMLGMHFDDCNPIGLTVNFDNCNLSSSIFYKTKLKKTTFKNSKLHEADLTECNLNGSLFEGCDLLGATFANTIIEKTDLSTSFNYSIDPERNMIKKAKFSLSGIAGLLDKYDIEIV